MWDMYSKEDIDSKCRKGTMAWIHESKTVNKFTKYEGYVWLYAIGLLLILLMFL